MRRTDVWISRDEIVDFLEYDASSDKENGASVTVFKVETGKEKDALDASVAMRSKISLTNELRMAIALLEIPVSGWTCLRTKDKVRRVQGGKGERETRTLVDVGAVSLLAALAALLLLAVGGGTAARLRGGLLRLALSLSGSLGGGGGGRGLAGSGSGLTDAERRVRTRILFPHTNQSVY